MNNDIISSPLPLSRRGPLGVLFLVGGIALALAGLAATLYRLKEGLGVTHLGSTVPWGLYVACYIYFIGLSAGSFLLSSLVFVFGNKSLEPLSRLAVFQAFVCLILGLVFIFLDLGHWERFWHVIVYPQWHSVLAWEIWFYNAYIVVLLLELWFLMRCDLSNWGRATGGLAGKIYRALSFGFCCPQTEGERERCEHKTLRWLKILGIIGIPVALGVHGGTGAIFAVVKSRPAWYSAIFPLVFIISALVSGGGLLLFLRVFMAPDPKVDRRILPDVAKLVAGFLIFDLLLLFLEFLVGFYGGIPDHVKPYQLMISGSFAWVFWGQQLALGAVIPLLLIFVRSVGSKYETKKLGIAGFCVFVGIFGVRLNIVIPALAVPVFPGIDTAMDSPRLAALYIPNWVEWLSSWGVAAAGVLLAYYLMRKLPLREHQPPPGGAVVCKPNLQT